MLFRSPSIHPFIRLFSFFRLFFFHHALILRIMKKCSRTKNEKEREREREREEKERKSNNVPCQCRCYKPTSPPIHSSISSVKGLKKTARSMLDASSIVADQRGRACICVLILIIVIMIPLVALQPSILLFNATLPLLLLVPLLSVPCYTMPCRL